MLRRLEEKLGLQPDEESYDFTPLRILTAQLLLVTAAEAVFNGLRQGGQEGSLDQPRQRRTGSATAATWAPSVLAPLAATAHLARATKASRVPDLATRILDTAVVGAGVGAAVAGLLARRGEEPSRATPPLALAMAGILGLVLDSQEREHAREHQRLARRASIVERLVPARRSRLDHIVVHV